MLKVLLSPEGFGPIILGIALGWTPVLLPLVYLAIWGRKLPRKFYFVAVCCGLTLGLPMFFFMGLQAPLLAIQPIYDMLILEQSLQKTAPFSWIRDALNLVSSWKWLITAIVFIAVGIIWNAFLCWYVGRRWAAITVVLASLRNPPPASGTNDA